MVRLCPLLILILLDYLPYLLRSMTFFRKFRLFIRRFSSYFKVNRNLYSVAFTRSLY